MSNRSRNCHTSHAQINHETASANALKRITNICHFVTTCSNNSTCLKNSRISNRASAHSAFERRWVKCALHREHQRIDFGCACSKKVQSQSE